MSAVYLTELIVIEEEEKRPDGMGGFIKEWFSKYVTWAQALPLYNKKQLGHEVAVSKQIQSINFYEFTIRYRRGINNTMRIKSQNRLFNIVKVITQPNKRFLEIVAKEVVAG